MSHEQIRPPIPFSDSDRAVMRGDDVKAARYIATLTSCIFLMGIGIYVTVLVATILTPPLYAIR